jgi:hypothetical protein
MKILLIEMINEKIDHHFNEYSPLDFNIFQGTNLFDKLETEKLPYETAKELLEYISGIKEQIRSLLNQEDEQLTTVYGFLTTEEQQEYFNFLRIIEEDAKKYKTENKITL